MAVIHSDSVPAPVVRVETGWRLVLRRWLALYWPLVVVGVVVVVGSVVSRRVLSPGFSWNRDEPVYLWHMEVLRSGRFTSTDGGEQLFFRPWLTGSADGRLFSQYTLGWPLVLVLGDVVFGSPAVMLPLGALLAVIGTYAFTRELTSDHRLAVVSSVVMAACPVVVIQGGMYLGYLFTLGLGLFFAAALLSGVRRDQRGRLVVAGLLLGWVFLTRPFDAVIWGAAVVGYVVVVRRGEWRRLVRSAVWFTVGVLPLVAITLAYNKHVTGGLVEFPVTAAEPLDKYGFGRRRIMPAFGTVDYTVMEAIKGAGKNILFFPLFLTGSYLGVLVAAAGLWLRRRDRTTLVLLAIGALFPLAYFPFWGMTLSGFYAKYSGSFYYMPLYVPFSILIATVILAAWARRRALGISVLVVLAAATVPPALNRFDQNRQLSEAQVPWKHSTDSINGPALVFVSESGPYLIYVNPFSSNEPDLDGEILYAADRGAANLDLIAKMPDRTPYVQQASEPIADLLPRIHPVTPEVTVTPLRVLEGNVISLDVRVNNPEGRSTVVVSLTIDRHIEHRTLSTNSTAGATHETTWHIGVPGARSPTAGEPIATLPDRLGRVVIMVGLGSDENDARGDPVARQEFPYRVDGQSAEILLPSEEFRARQKDGERYWRRAPTDPELKVNARVQ